MHFKMENKSMRYVSDNWMSFQLTVLAAFSPRNVCRV